MSEDVWSAEDTTPEAIDAALRRMLHDRHQENAALAPARVLNLIVVADRDWKGEVANRLERVGRYHASRTILCAVEPGRGRIDAKAIMGYEDADSGGLGVMREQVEIDLGEQHLERLAVIVDPVVEEDLPVMLWCPHGHEQAMESLRRMTDIVLLDSDEQEDAQVAFARAEDLLKDGYVVDLAWLRTTPWRERLASAFDLPDRLALLAKVEQVQVRFRPDSIASALLLAGWLASRLGWELGELGTVAGGELAATAERADGGEVELAFEPVDQESPGLAGVTVAVDGFSLSLDRARGGLQARVRDGETERSWHVLGASRGEGGILGEGVRQALLRDPTYGPAERAAQGFWS